METYSVFMELLCSYDHFKSGVFISHSGDRRRGATRVVKGGTQKKLGNIYSHLDEK